MQALIYKSTGSWYIAKTESGQVYNTRIKGIFKIEDITSTNPIAVGDIVKLMPETEEGNTAMITAIEDRKNYIARSSPHNKSQHHIIASNLDQTLLFATIREPRTSQGFIDRFLVTAEAYHVPAIIVFNKADVYRPKDMAVFEMFKDMYEACGYQVVKLSMQTGEGLPQLEELLHDKISLLSGHSGVGKSTFINAILPGYNLRTTEVSTWSGKGMHTTTFAEMFDLPFGGKIIDTPGIREFGIIDISRQELSHYFPEMRELINDCYYNNCLHTNEPGCAVKAAVESGNIAESRYISYLTIMDSIEEKLY
jgi:ribosome biogenesis GTPase